MQTTTAAALRMDDYFSVPGSNNVYKVSFIHGERRFIEGRRVCEHTADAIPIVKLEFRETVKILYIEDTNEHKLHSSWAE